MASEGSKTRKIRKRIRPIDNDNDNKGAVPVPSPATRPAASLVNKETQEEIKRLTKQYSDGIMALLEGEPAILIFEVYTVVQDAMRANMTDFVRLAIMSPSTPVAITPSRPAGRSAGPSSLDR